MDWSSAIFNGLLKYLNTNHVRTDSADNELISFFLFFPENMIQLRRQFAWNVKFYFLGKKEKISECRLMIFTQHA